MLRVNIVGIGPGNPELLTNQARQAIEESNILIGDKRMLAAFGAGKCLFDTIKSSEITEICQKADADPIPNFFAMYFATSTDLYG